EEPVERVFAGLQAIHRSLARAGALDRFHFFVLSDSANPSAAVREEEAWFDWCRAVGGFGRIFYRRRKVRLERKSGNVADFCRRWGRRYRYMVMLDADSLMTGETVVRLVELMERHPGVGMIQTAPAAVNRSSLFARVQQFASRVYGPMFAAGLHYWQLGDGQYWGHNTIVRVEPFMDHCALPRLPGREPLGGEILSHDFVEAALMGRAGWSLWLAYDLGGSYEETPSTLLEEMKRDRRWCQGNLQHLRLLFTEGLFGAHRALFLNGALSYMSALLWFVFLTLSTVEALATALREPEYFPHGASLFPEWPIWRPDWALWLLAVRALILSVPLSVYTSRSSLGERARRWGLFVIPEETAPPPELQDLRELARTARQRMRALPERERDGFVRAAVDPYVNALHRALLGRSRSLAPSLQAARQALLERALAEGPASLTGRERRILLGDPDLTDALHRRVWARPDRERAARWGR